MLLFVGFIVFVKEIYTSVACDIAICFEPYSLCFLQLPDCWFSYLYQHWDQKMQNSLFYEAFLPITCPQSLTHSRDHFSCHLNQAECGSGPAVTQAMELRNTVNDYMSRVTSRSPEQFGWFACDLRDYRKIPKISLSKYKPLKPVTQKTFR